MNRPPLRHYTRRDPSDVARSAEVFATETDQPDAWLIAADAWEEAGDIRRAELLRSFSGEDEQSIVRDFQRGVEDGLWLLAWASAMEEEGLPTPRNITRETADPAPRSVSQLARRYMATLARLNRSPGRAQGRTVIGRKILAIVRRAALADGRPINPEELGYYLTMQSLGHGVSWTDDHACFDVIIPTVSAGALRRWPTGWVFHGEVSARFARPIC